MAPIRTYTNWNARSSNKEEQIEPYKHYYFVCEGQNTERWYFEKFIDLRKDFEISSLISIEYLEKTGKHKTWSNPKKLYELANSSRKNGDISFDSKRDKMIIVFDADIYEARDKSVYEQFIKEASKENVICVTNPSFELFLLLHYENSYEELIYPNRTAILKNQWVDVEGERIRYIEHLFRQKSGLKPKKASEIAELVKDVSIAIIQEQKINNDICICRGVLTSNVGVIIKSILEDKCDEDNKF